MTEQTSNYSQALALAENILRSQDNIPWMQHRALGKGEVSVLLKHYYALSNISVSSGGWGLIAEDDIIHNDKTVYLFNKCIQEFESTDADYMDLAGGVVFFECRI